jgi:transcriptional regulator with XRE-family HTH domain
MRKRLIIKDIREKRGLTQAELAAEIGMNRALLSQIECGHMLPTLDTLLAIARALGCKEIDLYDDPELDLIKMK